MGSVLLGRIPCVPLVPKSLSAHLVTIICKPETAV